MDWPRELSFVSFEGPAVSTSTTTVDLDVAGSPLLQVARERGERPDVQQTEVYCYSLRTGWFASQLAHVFYFSQNQSARVFHLSQHQLARVDYLYHRMRSRSLSLPRRRIRGAEALWTRLPVMMKLTRSQKCDRDSKTDAKNRCSERNLAG